MYVVDGLDPGGTRSVLLSQLAEIPRDRFDIGLLTLHDDLAVAADLVPPDVTVMSGPMPRDLEYGVHDYLADSWLLRTAKRSGSPALKAIASFKPDILHFHTHPRTLALGILARRENPVGLVFTDHAVRIAAGEYSPHARFLLRMAYRRLYRHYDVISVGPSVAASQRSGRFIGRDHRHIVLANQVDLDLFRPPDDWHRARPLEVIYVGRLHVAKGVETVIRAFSQVRTDVPVRLVVAGTDEMGGRLQRLASEIVQAPKSVAFLGDRSDVAALLRQASIGVLMSEREGQSLAILEQMASGLAVIASDIPENAEMLSDGVSGRLVQVGDVNGCAAALEELVADEELRMRFGRAARKAAETRSSTDEAQMLLDFYAAVIAGRQ
jgi:glycosyltransferase involved in cell wall biosynthesis